MDPDETLRELLELAAREYPDDHDAGRLSKADEDQLIEDCKNGRRFH